MKGRMRFALFFDSETTGLVDFKAPSDAPNQPHIVQLAAALVDLDTMETVQSMDVIVCPNGWTIPEQVSDIHGITTEHAERVGVPELLAVNLFLELWNASDVRIGHNISFDDRIIRIALKRYFDNQIAEVFAAGKTECTQRLSTPIVKAPPTEKMLRAGRTHYKSASLSEAYKHFTGKDLVGAHSAMTDVKACIDVYFAIKAMECAA